MIEEFRVVNSSPLQGKRHLDALIVLGEPMSISASKNFDITGKDVSVIQTKAKRLGMYLLGQCLFSRDLVLNTGFNRHFAHVEHGSAVASFYSEQVVITLVLNG